MGLFTNVTRAPAMISADQALPGRDEPVLRQPTFHEVFGVPVDSTPAGSSTCHVALGCFWGAEQMFWQTPGVTNTAVGYAGGYTPNPTYEEVCSGRTGHTETVRICFDPGRVSLDQLLTLFFENHDPTQGMRQGNDVGTQYRSAVFAADPDQAETARRIRDRYQEALTAHGYGQISTVITDDGAFYYAEDYHQQYLVKNPNGYCPVHATGVTCG